MRIFLNGLTRIERVMQYVANVIVLVIAIVVTSEVVSRKVLNYSIPGSYETGEQSLVFIIYLGLAFCQSVGGHLRVGLFIENSRGRKKEIWEAIALFIALLISLLLLWQTGSWGLQAFRIREYSAGMINYPVWPGKVIIPVGIFFLCLRLVRQIVEHIGNARRGTPPVSAKEIVELSPSSEGGA